MAGYDEWDVDAAMAEGLSLDELVKRKEDAMFNDEAQAREDAAPEALWMDEYHTLALAEDYTRMLDRAIAGPCGCRSGCSCASGFDNGGE